MAGSSAEVPNDIENPPIQLEISMKQELDTLSPLTQSCCIYRVPERLRRGKPNAYTPQVVSIGPVHHGNKGLIAMEEQKKRYLQDFIRRTNISLENYLLIIRDHEQELRNCYAETIGLKSDDFVKIILVDAAFIIELLLKYRFVQLRDKSDWIFNKPWKLLDVWGDLRLLENQLPFFILDKLHDPNTTSVMETSSLVDQKSSLVDHSLYFFSSIMQEGGLRAKLKSSSRLQHFVDLVRHLYLQPQAKPANATETPRSATSTTPTMITMTELHLAGVRFKVRTSENLFDIQFDAGTLEIPKLVLSDEAEVTIRNLLAFEQCHCYENYINDYVFMMDQLVNTSEDVELLVKYGIVENRLGDNSAGAALINNLAHGVLISNDCQYATIYEHLNQHCKNSWNRWKANLCHKYFNTPWAGISVAAAVVIIVLTIMQTVFSGMSAT